MDKSRTATDLAVAHQALANIVNVLRDVSPSSDTAWYEVGRALGMAKLGLIESGSGVPPYSVRKALREETLKVGR